MLSAQSLNRHCVQNCDIFTLSCLHFEVRQTEEDEEQN